MNFYTLIFNEYSPIKWIKQGFIGILTIITLLFGFNYIIDPYNITHYNILNIKYKFARDDRTEKINYFKTLPPFENILLGSSRVYSINPKKVSEIFGGTTYNFGVGAATVEDQLGVLLYLERENKLPKNLFIGVDFYTFNPDIPLNSYFLSNKELNFLSFKNQSSNEYWSKFFSLDATRASIKTFKNHLTHKNEKPRFDRLGWGLCYATTQGRNLENEKKFTLEEIYKNKDKMYSDYEFAHIDTKRVKHYEEIKALCKKHKINLYIFTTPLNPILLHELRRHPKTNNALHELTAYLSTFKHFTNFYNDLNFTSNPYLYGGAFHTTARAGDQIMVKIYNQSKP